jgi:HTH-type transcriptional regulator/antitoxin HigA
MGMINQAVVNRRVKFSFEATQEQSFPETIATLFPLWTNFSKILSVPHTEAQYQYALTFFEKLAEIVGDNHTHPLSSLLETLALLIENYEKEHYPVSDVSGIEILQFLMEQNALTVNDLPEIGNSTQVADVLNGKLLLNTQQIQRLSQRFHVSPTLFLEPNK